MKQWFAKLGQGLLRGLYAVVPIAGDTRREWIRKLAFWMALVVLLCSGYYLVDELWLQPRHAKQITHSLREMYTKGEVPNSWQGDPDVTPVEFPEGMDEAFEPLYRRNQDVRGWLTFATAGADDLFEGAIDNPVVQAEDNDYYLYRDYLGRRDKAGTLYFDYRNNIREITEEKNTIIYGHNLNSGLMFSKFNRLVGGNVEYARRLHTVSLDTLYGETVTYKVFAVMVIDADATGSAAFNYIATEFSDQQFSRFVEGIRKRSLYDFGDVSVEKGDQLLTLSTCSNKRDTTLKNGRTVIVARRLRKGEDAAVDSSLTVKNEDVLMPKAWYVNKGKALPSVYQ